MGAAKKVGTAILVLMFIMGLLIAIAGFIGENTTPITDPAHLDAMQMKFAGVIILIIPVGIGLALSSGTGRPHGGRRYKGLGGINKAYGKESKNHHLRQSR